MEYLISIFAIFHIFARHAFPPIELANYVLKCGYAAHGDVAGRLVQRWKPFRECRALELKVGGGSEGGGGCHECNQMSCAER